MLKKKYFRDRLYSHTPRWLVRNYIEEVTAAVEGLDKLHFCDLISKEMDGRRWGRQASVGEVFNQAALRVLVDVVGRDFQMYDRLVQSFRTPHNKQLAGLKLRILGDPQYRVAKKTQYFHRRPWVSSISVQAVIESLLSELPWFESVRVDQSKLDEFSGTVQVKGGMIVFTVQTLSTRDGKNIVRLSLDRTSMEGDIAVLVDYASEVEVVGLISGGVFDKGDNAEAEKQAIKQCWRKVLKDHQEVFVVELYSPPNDGCVSPFDFEVLLPSLGRNASLKDGLQIPDFKKAPLGAVEDFVKVWLKENPEIAKKKQISEEQIEEGLGLYQRSLHDVSFTDAKRKLIEEGFTVIPRKKVDRVPMDIGRGELQPMKWMTGVAKSLLEDNTRKAINRFADKFYVLLTKVQAAFGGKVFSYRSPSISRPLGEMGPSACWTLSSSDFTKWHYGFKADSREKVEAALKRMKNWFKRQSQNKAKVVRVSYVKSGKDWLGSSVLSIPVDCFLDRKAVKKFFVGDPNSGVPGEDVEVLKEYQEEIGPVAEVRFSNGRVDVVPVAMLEDIGE
jgi:hypothetical protein